MRWGSFRSRRTGTHTLPLALTALGAGLWVLRTFTPGTPLPRRLYSLAVNARDGVYWRPNVWGWRATDLVIAESARLLLQDPSLTQAGLETRVGPLSRGLKRARWSLDVMAARYPGRVAVAADLGSYSRLAVFDAVTREEIPVPEGSRWQASQVPEFTPDGDLLVQSVIFGVPPRLRIEVLSPTGKGDQGYRLTWSRDVLDGHAWLSGDLLSINCAEEPQWARWVAGARYSCGRRLLFRVAHGKVACIGDAYRSDLYHFLDGWVAAAYAAERPDALQGRLRALLGVPQGRVDWPRIYVARRRTAIATISADTGSAVVYMSRGRDGYRVDAVH